MEIVGLISIIITTFHHYIDYLKQFMTHTVDNLIVIKTIFIILLLSHPYELDNLVNIQIMRLKFSC